MESISTDYKSTLIFFVNGKRVSLQNPDPSLTLLTFLRRQLRLTGTKLGCGEGGCGACTVMVSKYDRHTETVKNYSVNACLAPLCSMHGLAVTTVEGIGSLAKSLHPVQERIAKSHGSQCGFCTPGIVMSMYTLLRNRKTPQNEDLDVAFQGNLCRCTGYRPIIEGFRTFSKSDCCGGKINGECCMKEESDVDDIYGYELFDPTEFMPYDPSQEPLFPSELQMSRHFDEQSLKFTNATLEWYRPTTITQLLELKQKFPNAKIVNGNTEIGVEVKFKHAQYPTIICATNIKELSTLTVTKDSIICGAGVTLAHLDEESKRIAETPTDKRNDIFLALREMLHWFAGPQIRNVAAIGGNIMTASPISDLIPLLVAQGSTLTFLAKGSTERTVPMDQTFFTGYRKVAVNPDEILLRINIPRTSDCDYTRAYKQAHRREDDIAIVNAGMFVSFIPMTTTVKELRVCYGGMAPTCVVAKSVSTAFVGRNWDKALLNDVLAALEKDLPLPFGVPGGAEAYRRTLTLSFFFRFFLDISKELSATFTDVNIEDDDMSALGQVDNEPLKSSQLYDNVPKDQPSIDPVGRPIVHVNALKQASGEAVYVDDMPRFENELYMGLVLSQRSHAKLLSIDYTAALDMDGVFTYVDNSNLKETYFAITVACDEPVFADQKVVYFAQPIAGILAGTQEQAQAAARAVRVEYEDLEAVVTIDDAIAANKTADLHFRVEQGDPDAAFSECDVIVEGETRTGSQEHFYLETHGALAVPGEENEMCIYASTQNVTASQLAVASVLGIPSNRVVVKNKRCGGGFGGKETRNVPLSVMTAVAAKKAGRPVRLILDRDEDMLISGGRHPSLIKYKVGAKKSGRIIATETTIYLNAGFSEDLTAGVLGRAVFTSFGSLHIPNQRCRGVKCFTNLPSNTAFRGFGVPQSMFGVETWTTHLAEALNMSSEQIQEINLLKNEDMLPFGHAIMNVQLQPCWEKCRKISQFEDRRRRCDEYNKKSRWKKRGVAMSTVSYPCSYPIRTLNQSGALVHVYLDGSVLLSHGGIEMGQGLYTKTTQVASRVLGIPPEKIHIMETSSDKVPNTSATAASFGTDLNGPAVLNACKKIHDRLKPFIEKNPHGNWEDWVKAAYTNGISLSATGFHFDDLITTNITEDGRIQGKITAYYAFGASFSEVEIDCLTGDHVVKDVIIVMDIGSSLNPAIDIGQIEGAYMQGYGMYMMEEANYSPNGVSYTRGPGAYKIPGFGDVPRNFTVHLLHGSRCEHPHAVYSSKAVGEPPLLLSLSTFSAIRQAVKAAREDNGHQGYFRLEAPATCERIRLSCGDNLTERFPIPPNGSYQPWNVRL